MTLRELGEHFATCQIGEASKAWVRRAPLGKNGEVVLTSYATPIAVCDGTTATFVTDRYSTTTARHRSVALGACTEEGVRVRYAGAEEFSKLLDELGIGERGRG